MEKSLDIMVHSITKASREQEIQSMQAEFSNTIQAMKRDHEKEILSLKVELTRTKQLLLHVLTASKEQIAVGENDIQAIMAVHKHSLKRKAVMDELVDLQKKVAM